MALEFEIAPGRRVGGDNPCFFIAEIGQNHQGDINIAKEMIRLVKAAGADCAKFQKCDVDVKFNKAAQARLYNSPHSWGKTYGEHKRFIEFSREQFYELKKFAEEEVGIVFSSSGTDQVAADFLLDDLKIPFLKVASADNNNLPFLEHIAKKGRPLVISSGMQSMDMIRSIYRSVKALNPNFALLQCTSTYPANPDDIHLRCITTFQKEFPDIPIGYSGHEEGISISLGAVVLGAKIVERHVTINKGWKGNDHAASLEMSELAELIKQIRIVERALGTPFKEMRASEMPCQRKLGKSVVATRDIPVGTTLSLEMLAVKVAEPPGMPPQKIFDLIGRITKKDIGDDETVMEEDIE
jgi:sialic acid synthase